MIIQGRFLKAKALKENKKEAEIIVGIINDILNGRESMACYLAVSTVLISLVKNNFSKKDHPVVMETILKALRETL